MDDYLNQSKRSSFSFNDITQFLILLLVAKCFKSFGIYIGYDLLKHLHVVQLLFYTSLIASIFLLDNNIYLNTFLLFSLLKIIINNIVEVSFS